tara:strand:- start:21292 stop:21888 length:597 start_codon:yes stop_codon:yes gene_type:complete
MKNKTNRKGSKPIKWTVKDTNTLLKCKDRKEVRALAPTLNRTESACIQRWSSTNKLMKGSIARPVSNKEMGKLVAKKSPKPKNSIKTVKPKKNTKRKKYAPRWTPEEELYLLCNFYELSVDEAKAQFNRSYGQIASQLEKIIESDKPEHLSMLSKAAGIISERKKAQQTPLKLTRKERRLAKKQAKLQRQLDKMRDKV